ncbi:hypothetical protein [Alicyclobacillus vulcanalis]|uniref:Lipoprotein n=1 Tax=Alicyclobacillus vulcanalis TaxID=252246 RepID=A0A1N7MAY2_9BACL|nr:hypothetical protein [Alicyclobacillus vulcanalis]SIS83213.1 hypothetical protein SAMN05421799_10515 [Alicyclobacillus vulcanalis]
MAARTWLSRAACSAAFLGACAAVTGCGAPQTSSTSEWIVVNHWMVDAVTTKQAPLPLQCLLLNVYPTTESVVSSAELRAPGLKTRTFAQQELQLGKDTVEFQLRFNTVASHTLRGTEPTLSVATPKWSRTFSFGEMDVSVVPNSVHWLTPVRSFAGESGSYSTSHPYVIVVENPLHHPVTFAGFAVGGGVDLVRTAYAINPKQVSLTLPKQSLPAGSSISIAPGQTAALYCIFRQPSAYRNVYFQPALRLTYQGVVGYELTNPALYTEGKFSSDPTSIYPTVTG